MTGSARRFPGLLPSSPVLVRRMLPGLPAGAPRAPRPPGPAPRRRRRTSPDGRGASGGRGGGRCAPTASPPADAVPREWPPPATGTPPVPMRPPRGPAGRRPGPVRCPPPGPSGVRAEVESAPYITPVSAFRRRDEPGHPVRRRFREGHPPDVAAGEGGRQGVQPSVVRLQVRRPERTGAPGGEARASVGVPVLPLPVPLGHPASGQHGDLHAASARRLGPEGGRAGGVRRERQQPPVRMPYGSSPPPPVAPSAQENGEGGHVVLRHHGELGDLLVRDGQAESGEAREQGGQRDARLDA